MISFWVAAHVRKEHRQFNDRAARMLEAVTFFAIARVIARLILARQVHDEAAHPFKWRTAQFTTRTGGKQTQEVTEVTGDVLALYQKFVPVLFGWCFI
jgi:hypothetical protein